MLPSKEWQGLKRPTATVTGPHSVSEPPEWEKSDQPSQDELWILGDSDGHEVEVGEGVPGRQLRMPGTN